jgi:transposase InsO family protein
MVGQPATIVTTGNPIRQKAYRLPLMKRRTVEDEIEKMLAAKIIRPSQSPWAAPITLQSKKDGSVRFCVDYRRINAITMKDAGPLPLIQDVFDNLQGAQIFSTLDLKSGYWQVDVAEEDIPKTAFITHRGLYEFVRLPFGLTNAPAQFQRLMNFILRDFIGKTCCVYLDDIVVFGRTPHEHKDRLQKVLDALHAAGLTLKQKKCFLGREQVELLGYTVSAQGITAQEDKLAAIRNMAAPTDVKAIQRFMGMTGYYRQLIPRYADISAPLITLTKKGEPWRWGTDEDTAFRELRAALTSDRIVAHPDPSRPYCLYTDASNMAVGAILTQTDDMGVERPIHYVSKALNGAQRRWSAIEREAFAIVHALRKLRAYLQGAALTILTDHKPLRSLFQCELSNSKIQRWGMLISEFSPTLEYRKGSDNVRADMLSRLPDQKETASIQEALCTPQLSDHQRLAFPEQWTRAESEEDDEFLLLEGELYSLRLPYVGAAPYPRLMAPPSIRPRLLNEAHTETGHRGRHALLRRLQAFTVWPGMVTDVKIRTQTCPHCLGNQRKPQPTIPQITETPKRPFERVGVDLTGPFLPSLQNNRYLLCMVDHLTGWAEAIPIPDKRATTVWAALMTEIFPRHGHPQTLITDNGLEFANEVFTTGCRALQIHHVRTTPVRPQSNGVVERFNRTLKDTLRKLMNNQTSSWQEHLAAALWAYRISASEARGTSPFELLYGYPPDTPDIDDPDGRFEVLTRARNHAVLQQEKNKLQRQELSRLLPTDKRQVKIHDCITIDQPEPVSFSHLRDHGFRVISIRGKVIGYVPITADRNQRPRHVHIDRVQVVPEVNWQEVNPRPRRNRRGPDVRTTQLIEHAADTGTSKINNTDNFEPPPTNDPGLNEQAPENTGPPDVWHSRLQSRSHTTCGDQSTQPWTIVLSRKRRQRRKDRARRNDPADSDEEPPEARLRIAASRLRARNTDPTRT